MWSSPVVFVTVVRLDFPSPRCVVSVVLIGNSGFLSFAIVSNFLYFGWLLNRNARHYPPNWYASTDLMGTIALVSAVIWIVLAYSSLTRFVAHCLRSSCYS